MKLLIMEFSPASYYFIPLGFKYSSQGLFSNTFSLCSSLDIRDQVSDSYKTTRKTIYVYIYIYILYYINFLHFQAADEKTKRKKGSELNCSKHQPSLICS
jgi:hypothetical protein